jgi:hypothetical protein
VREFVAFHGFSTFSIIATAQRTTNRPMRGLK